MINSNFIQGNNNMKKFLGTKDKNLFTEVHVLEESISNTSRVIMDDGKIDYVENSKLHDSEALCIVSAK